MRKVRQPSATTPPEAWTPMQRWIHTPSMANAVGLAIADHMELGIIDHKFLQVLRAAEARLRAIESEPPKKE